MIACGPSTPIAFDRTERLMRLGNRPADSGRRPTSWPSRSSPQVEHTIDIGDLIRPQVAVLTGRVLRPQSA